MAMVEYNQNKLLLKGGSNMQKKIKLDDFLSYTLDELPNSASACGSKRTRRS